MAEDSNANKSKSDVHKNYKQKFRACWLEGEFSEWLIRCPDNPDIPFCKFCLHKIEGGISHLRRHAKTLYHKKRFSKSDLGSQGIVDNLSSLGEKTSLKTLKVKPKKPRKPKNSTRENSANEASFHYNNDNTETISNSLIEASCEESGPLQIACMSAPQLATQQKSQAGGQHHSEHTAAMGLNPAIHQNSFMESTSSLPSVVTSHVSAEFHNNHLNDSHHLQPLHVHHDLQVSDVAQPNLTGHGEIFTSDISSPTKLQNEAYLMEVNDVGSSCEVSVGGSHSTCQTLTSLESDHHARHITVTIQGQDPMYIHSSMNPESHIECAAQEQQTETCISASLNDNMEEPVQSVKPRKRKSKSKKPSRSRVENGRDSGCDSGGRRVKDECFDSSHHDGSKSDTDDDVKGDKRTSKWYRQKYKKNWENTQQFSGWLSPAPADPSIAFCIACSKCLKGGLTHLKRHADTPYHKKRMLETIKKRELIRAKNIELRLSNFAHQFGLSEKAACALPELLKNIFPDNNLCKLLSDDRMMAMLLVHQESFGSSKKYTEKFEDQMRSSIGSQLETSGSVNAESVILDSQDSSYAELDSRESDVIAVGEHRGAVIVHQMNTDGDLKTCTRSVTHHNSSLPLSESVRDRWQGRVAIVTGANDAIGAAICCSLVAIGMRVVGVACSHHRLQALAEELSGARGSLTALQCDVSKDDEVERAFAEVLRTHGAVHCCINNAGISANASLLDGCPSQWRGMLEVNVVGLCLLTKLCVNSMMEKGIDDGHIIHISSTSDHSIVSDPSAHFHADTKLLTDCLRQELRTAKSHIKVSSISPGRVSMEDASASPGRGAMGVQPDHVAASVVHVLCASPCVEINVSLRPT